jgi:hypothetical protein
MRKVLCTEHYFVVFSSVYIKRSVVKIQEKFLSDIQKYKIKDYHIFWGLTQDIFLKLLKSLNSLLKH